MAPKSSKPAPVLKQFANFWTLTHQPSKEKEWSMEEKFKQAKKAGFTSMGGGAMPGIADLCAKYDMDYVCYTDADAKSYRERLEIVKKTNPARVNVQVCDHDTPPAKAVDVWIKTEALAEKLGLNVDLEVHRDTCTETPEKVYEIADLYKKATGKKIRFCWDFSHVSVVKHLSPPYAERLIERPDLVQLAKQMHFRPFNGHHCQIPATDGKGNETEAFKHYLEFVDTLIGIWLKGAKGGETLYVCPEFGPVASGYGLPAFPNVWKDAIHLRARTEELWNAHIKKGWGK